MKLILFILLYSPLLCLAQNNVQEPQLKPVDYKLNTLFYDVADDDVRAIIVKDASNIKVKKGQTLDHKVFEQERSRIEKIVMMITYPPFTKREVIYEVDSLPGHLYNLKLIVREKVGGKL